MKIPPSQFGTAPGGLEPHRGTLILVLGILSLVLCSFFTGIPAWIMGKGDLAKIKEGMMDPEGEGSTKAGMICCIIKRSLNRFIHFIDDSWKWLCRLNS